MLSKSEIKNNSREGFPSNDILVAKNINMTELQKWEMQQVSDLLRSSGINCTVSEMIRLCIKHSWKEIVKPKLCLHVGLFDPPCFESK